MEDLRDKNQSSQFHSPKGYFGKQLFLDHSYSCATMILYVHRERIESLCLRDVANDLIAAHKTHLDWN